MAVQINNSLEEYRHIIIQSTFDEPLSTALFLNTRTWSFLKLQLQRKQKNSLPITFFEVWSVHGHEINIRLKKGEIIRRWHFTCITPHYEVTVTQ